jgi:hypothetical protein
MDLSANEFLEHALNDLSGAILDTDKVLSLAKSLALKTKAAKDLKLDQKIDVVQTTLRALLEAQKELDPAVVASIAEAIDTVVPHTVLVSVKGGWVSFFRSLTCVCRTALNVLSPKAGVPVVSSDSAPATADPAAVPAASADATPAKVEVSIAEPVTKETTSVQV